MEKINEKIKEKKNKRNEQNESISLIKRIIGHSKTIFKHKWLVFKLCCKAGIPWRGFVHDLSKFSPSEFWPGVKYYTEGKYSPILNEKLNTGYSNAWLHHKGRNKHHLEYWVDYATRIVAPVIPYKYLVEAICDELSAGMVYSGENWNNGTQYEYYTTKQRLQTIVNPKVDLFLTEVFFEVKEKGIEKTIVKRKLKAKYKKYCIDDNTMYEYEVQGGVWKRI